MFAIDPNIVAWYKLDHKGPSDFTAYDETLSYDGTLQNMLGTEWTGGKVAGALDFDGTNDHVSLPNLGFSGNVSLSVAAWIWVDPIKRITAA